MELQSHINEYLIQWEDDMSKKEDIQQFVCQVMKLGSLANVIGPHSGKVDVPESIDDWRINDNEITFVMTDGSEYRLFVYRDRYAVVEGYEDAHIREEC